MNKLQTFHDFLSNIQKMLTEKLEKQEIDLKETENNVRLYNEELITELKISLEHTKGQLYETNYILENFWDIISKK